MSQEKSNESSSEYESSEYDSDNSDSDSGLDSANGNEENDTTEELQTDKDGFVILKPGRNLGSYEIGPVLGEGSYGRVLHVTHIATGQNAALKVGKNSREKRQMAMAEIIALTIISCRDPNNNSLCIKMLNWFNYNGHICIAFPVLGKSVFDFIQENGYVPFAMDEVRHISYQLCSAVSFLHDNGLTHTDLKPENMLFVNSSYRTELNAERTVIRRIICTDIRLIDFGNVTRDHEYHCPTVSTAYYRAPEVILQLGWSHPCDVWSIGCTLVEIYCGSLLFPADNDRERLVMLEKTLGPIPVRMLNTSKRSFIVNGKLNFTLNEKEKESIEYSKPLEDFQLSDDEDDNVLFSLIKRMLTYDPTKRITLKTALLHSYFYKLPQHQQNRDNSRN